MRARRAALLSLAAATSAVVLLAAGFASGDEPYRLRLVLDHTSGLREGSEVRVGDVTAGEVASVELGPRDEVVIELELDDDQAPAGRDVSVAISTLNLLGQKYVALERGDPRAAAPSGFTIPRSRVGVSTDLDQVLAALDADTRTRLAILINEAGFALSGRRADFNALLEELPRTSAQATQLLEQLVADNRTLAHLVERGDRFLVEMARERRQLARTLDAVGQTATTFAGRRAKLRGTLARAPRTLRTLQRFLGELRSTTVPLGPAARNITATAPALTATLEQVEPFRRAAEPALAEATAAAPPLMRLAEGATPVLRRAIPTVRSVASFGRELVPFTDALDGSVDNLLAVVHNWSRAIQIRDGLSHIFNAQVVITPETLRSLTSQLAGGAGAAGRPPRRRERPAAPPRRPSPDGPRQDRNRPRVELRHDLTELLAPQVSQPLEPGSPDVSTVLDFLLGP